MSDLTQEQITNIVNDFKKEFPVRVGALANALGMSVIVTSDLPEGISGSFSKENGDYVIYVNETHPTHRRRFTIAHEIGHFIKHRNLIETGQEILSPAKKVMALNRPNHSSHSIANPDDRARELEADEFAAELLMPEDAFKQVWKNANRLSEVSDYFKVSGIAANVRAMKLNLGYFD